MEEFIRFKNGSAFLSGADFSKCDHDDEGEPIITFYHSDKIMKQCDYIALTSLEKEKLNISGGCCICSKCGTPYWLIKNPHYL